MSRTENEIECMDCGAVPRLCEVPYGEADYIVSCECDRRSIDVGSVVNGHSLVHPLSGKWSNIDHDHKKHR